MKICLITGSYPPDRCGVGDHVRELASALTRQGQTAIVLTSRPSGEEGPAEPDTFAVERVAHDWQGCGLGQIMRRLRKLRPEVVHLHYPSAGYGRSLGPSLLLPWIRLRLPQVRCVITLHEFTIFSNWGRWRLLPNLFACHWIVCTNHHDRRCLRQHYPRLHRKVKIIPLGSNLGDCDQAASPVLDTRWLAHFGMVMPNKGWETLIPALQRLREQGHRVGLRMTGELVPERYAYHRQVADMIKAAGLEDAIQFTGFLSRQAAAADLQRCSLAVLPFHGGVRLNRSSLVAALCLGLAVVTTRPSSPVEGLRHGQAYWTVPENDPVALAKAIAWLLERPEEIRKLQAGARRAAQRFAWTRIARQFQSLYQA